MKMCWLLRRGIVAYQDGTLGQRKAERMARHCTLSYLSTRASGSAAGDASPTYASWSFATICLLARSAPAAAGKDSATAARANPIRLVRLPRGFSRTPSARARFCCPDWHGAVRDRDIPRPGGRRVDLSHLLLPAYHAAVMEGHMRLAVVWQTLKELAIHPAEVLDQRLMEHRFIPSLALGMISYYWSMLQASEILLPPAIGGYAFWLVNFPVSLGRMVMTVLLIHLACQLVTRTGARWWSS